MVADLHQRTGSGPTAWARWPSLGGPRPTAEVAVEFAVGEPGLVLTFQQDGEGRWRLVTISDAMADEAPGRALEEPARP